MFGPYECGQGPVYGDPFRLYRGFVHGLGGEPGRVLRGCRSADETERFECVERLVATTREVFGLVPFDPADGSGVLDREAVELARQFLLWVEGVKKNGVTPPTSPPITELASCPDPWVTPDASVCG